MSVLCVCVCFVCVKAGNLYESYDTITSTEGFYAGVSNSALKFVPPSRDPPKIKDSVRRYTKHACAVVGLCRCTSAAGKVGHALQPAGAARHSSQCYILEEALY